FLDRCALGHRLARERTGPGGGGTPRRPLIGAARSLLDHQGTSIRSRFPAFSLRACLCRCDASPREVPCPQSSGLPPAAAHALAPPAPIHWTRAIDALRLRDRNRRGWPLPWPAWPASGSCPPHRERPVPPSQSAFSCYFRSFP